MKRNIYPMTMIEVVLALAIFSAISASFVTLLDSLDKANAKTASENAAIAVLDNCLERLSAIPAPKIKRISGILNDELSATPSHSANLASSTVKKIDAHHVELVIFDKNTKKIAGIKIKCEN